MVVVPPAGDAIDRSNQVATLSGSAVPPPITVKPCTSAEVMLGLGLVTGFAITPIRTGRIVAIVSGTVTNSVANAQINITGRRATGTAPANGAPVTGVLWGTTQHYVIKTSADVHSFTVIGGGTALPLNVATWFDLSIASPAGGVTTIAGCVGATPLTAGISAGGGED